MNPIASLVLGASLAVATLVPQHVFAAQSYPSKPVRIINPYPAAGAGDVLARALAAEMGKTLGQTVFVENRTGAAGNVGAEVVARAEPDGYTILLSPLSLYVVGPVLYSKLNYDPLKDLTPIIALASSGFVLVVHPSLPVRSVKELVALAKSRPGKMSYASVGNGSMVHLQGEMFKQMAGVDILHVPYRGGPAAITDLLSGQVEMTFDNVPTAVPFIKAGKLRALGVTGGKREVALPDVPTVSEAGVTGYEAVTWHALAAPANTPREMITTLNAAAVQGLSSPALVKRLADLSFQIIGGSPEQMAKLIEDSVRRWNPVVKAVKASGVKID